MIALASLLLLASAARAETVHLRMGPVELKGVIGPMDGPVADRDVVFDKPGWVSAVSFRALKADGQPADPAVFCHGILLDPREGDGRYVAEGNYNFERIHLTSYIGKNELRLPDGFGVEVDSGTPYRLEAMLRSPGVPRDGSYLLDVSYEFTPRGAAAPLRTLEMLRVAVAGDINRGHGIGEFHVGPGRLEREAAFTVPRDYVVHVIDFHVHRFVETIALVDASDGRVLYSGKVLKRADGWPELQPVYSSREGIPLKKTGRYLFRIDYDNRTQETDLSMAAMRLFVAGPEAPPAGEIRRLVGPVRLRGIQPAMLGPEGSVKVSFPGPGWIKGYRVHLRDASGADADDRGIFCHSVFRDPAIASFRLTPEIDGLRSMGMLLTSAEGAQTVRLPDGFGVAVDTFSDYQFEGVLQSPDGPKDGDYTFDVGFDYQSIEASPPLRTLTVMRVDAKSSANIGHGAGQWDVPPGRHSYTSEFGVPRDLSVHMIDFHLHRSTAKLELLDAGTGDVLYAADVKTGRDGYPIRPVYSSGDGFALSKTRRYRFRITYDNPKDRPEPTMALMFLFVSS
jgi:hypothetical protein